MDGGWPADERAEPRRARSRSPAREREIRDAPAPPPREDRERGSYGGIDDRSALEALVLALANSHVLWNRGAPPSSYRGPRNQPPAEKNNVIGVFGLSCVDMTILRNAKAEKCYAAFRLRNVTSKKSLVALVGESSSA